MTEACNLISQMQPNKIVRTDDRNGANQTTLPNFAILIQESKPSNLNCRNAMRNKHADPKQIINRTMRNFNPTGADQSSSKDHNFAK